MPAITLPSIICVHDDHWFLGSVIRSVSVAGPVTVLVSRLAWDGSHGDWSSAVEVANAAGAEVIMGDWPDESSHRRHALELLRARNVTFALIPDGDEIIEPELLASLESIAKQNLADNVGARMDTYWKGPNFVIRPREELVPTIMVNVQVVDHIAVRQFTGDRRIALSAGHGIIHHLSYAGPDERILRKISTWGHKDEVISGWFADVWKRWDSDPLMRNLHPTHPNAYGFAEYIAKPSILDEVESFVLEGKSSYNQVNSWPRVSVVIPVHNSVEDVTLCLESLAKIQDLLHETIVVDNNSSQDTIDQLRLHSFIKLIELENNVGFGAASNLGARNASGEVVVFLNSDTVVPRAGFVALVQTLMSSGSIAAAGPMSNNVGYHQRLSTTYTSLDTMTLFADLWANCGPADRDVEMLVGFCLAVRRTVLDEVGLFDERFGLGFFEDTDLCYRIQRAGYRLRLSSRAFVHHSGSKTITQVLADPMERLSQNERLFLRKWRNDIESGFASHLPGGSKPLGVIRFDPSKDPLSPGSEVSNLRSRARVSLCMIVRNEERVLADCLQSAAPFFFEIVVVDTGSQDATVQIAKSFGAKVVEISWPDSFAEARNVSLAHATGDWVFWIDADDTLPWHSGMRILQAAISAPNGTAGFVVPVQFTDDSFGGGTKVDHVKLFRRLPAVRFEGRIHEQILSSLRGVGEVARLDAVVLHSGYDTSEQGQQRKRVRDWSLLELDLRDRPGHPFVLFNLGMTHHFCDQHSEAISRLIECLQVSESHESHVRKAYSLLGLSHKRLGNTDESKRVFEEGLRVVGEDAELRFHLAMLGSESGDWEFARDNYRQILEPSGDYFTSVDAGILTYKKDFNLGIAYYNLGNFEDAKACFWSALKRAPTFEEAIRALHRVGLELRDVETLSRVTSHVELHIGQGELFFTLLFESQQATFGEICAYKVLYAFATAPESKRHALPVLGRVLFSRGRHAEASAVAKILAAEGSAEFCYYLGVDSIRSGHYESALHWMIQADQLNPGHESTLNQIAALRNALVEKS